MALGPGKYDDLATHVREHAKARAAIVIVIGGEKGSGFSVQTEGGLVLPLPLRDSGLLPPSLTRMPLSRVLSTSGT